MPGKWLVSLEKEEILMQFPRNPPLRLGSLSHWALVFRRYGAAAIFVPGLTVLSRMAAIGEAWLTGTSAFGYRRARRQTLAISLPSLRKACWAALLQ